MNSVLLPVPSNYLYQVNGAAVYVTGMKIREGFINSVRVEIHKNGKIATRVWPVKSRVKNLRSYVALFKYGSKEQKISNN